MNYAECEKMAIAALRFCRQKITDENIGIVIGYILTANSKYNTAIGNEFGFRKMYIQFAIKTIKTNMKKQSRITYNLEALTGLSKENKKNPFLFEDIKKYLNNREYEIIISKYRDNKTLSHIGSEIGCSTENVRLILKNSYKKLRKLNEYKEND